MDKINHTLYYRRLKRVLQSGFSRRLKRYLHSGTWGIDVIHIQKNTVQIEGWALPPLNRYHESSFSINGIEFDEIHFPTGHSREDIGRLFWYLPRANKSSFSCKIKIQDEINLSGEELVLRFVDQKSLQPYNTFNNYYYHKDIEAPPLPDPARRARVHGSDDLATFLLEGYSTFRKVETALFEVTGKSFKSFTHILDWGCGCGRMTRYFQKTQNPEITGIDIDQDNVAWCRDNLPFGYFKTVPLSPPSDLPANSFDLLIGISVFTHLKKDEQFEWLQELSRLAQPGAYLCMTVHGFQTVTRSALPLPAFRQLTSNGFLDLGHNPDLNDVIGESDYYRNTFHTPAYILREWSRHFNILKIIRGAIGNHQDLVIMRKDDNK